MSPSRFILVIILSLRTLACYGQTATIGDDAARPVKRFTSVTSRASEIEFFSFEFQRPYFGREGPNFTRLDGEPSADARSLVKADIFRQEAVATAKFELLDQNDRLLQLLYLSKSDNSLEDGQYAGFVKVPSRPFRVAVSGMDLNGKPYRRMYKRLFRPIDRPPAPPLVPPGFPPAETRRTKAGLEQLELETIANMEREANNHPDRVIVIPRIKVSNVTYEPFVSGKGNRLGMRLKYDVQFSAYGDYAHSLGLSPFYEDDNFRGLVDMEVIDEKINPRPEPPSYATPDIHVDLSTLVKYGSEAQFKSGIVYHFVVDLVPDFVGQNATRTKFCIDEEHYKNKVKSQKVWEAMKANAANIRYRLSINKFDWSGETEPFYPPKSFYEGFVSEAAVKCLPYKNINF